MTPPSRRILPSQYLGKKALVNMPGLLEDSSMASPYSSIEGLSLGFPETLFLAMN
jgi:hypothetical protein